MSPLALIGITYAVSIPTVFYIYGRSGWFSPLLQRAAKGCSRLEPLFRFLDHVELALLAPIDLLQVIVLTPFAAIAGLFQSRFRKAEPPCFLPLLRGMMSSRVRRQFDAWEHELSDRGVELMGDYQLRQKQPNKLVRYLIAADGETVIEVYWIEGLFELVCFTAFDDGSFVNTHLVEKSVFGELGLEPDQTMGSRRRLVLTGLTAGGLYDRHRAVCREWWQCRGAAPIRVDRDSYRELVIANEMDPNRRI